MQNARVRLRNGWSAVRPAKAEPLLFDAEVKAYIISVSPCGPVLSSPAVAAGSTIGQAGADEHERRGDARR